MTDACHNRPARAIRKTMRVAVLLCTVSSVAACTSTIFRPATLGNYNILSIDAKQRLIVSGTRADGTSVVCAEPSPDALVAAASYAAGQISRTTTDNDNVGASGGAGVAETVGNIGLRTQSIQLMRDGYYRICEAYLNSAIPGHIYFNIIQQIDMFMIALVAIESLGGTVTSPPLVLSPTQGVIVLPGGTEQDPPATDPALVAAVNSNTAEVTNVKDQLVSANATLNAIKTMLESHTDLDDARVKAIVDVVKVYAANRSDPTQYGFTK